MGSGLEFVHGLREDDPAWAAVANEVAQLELLPEGPPSVLALCALTLALSNTGLRDRAARLAEAALNGNATVGDRATNRVALRALGMCAMYDGRLHEAIAFFQRHREADPDQASLVADEVVMRQFVDDFDTSSALLACAQQQPAAPIAAGDSQIALANSELTGFYLLGRFDLADALATTIVADAQKRENERSAFYARTVLGRIAQLRGDFPAARRFLNAASGTSLRSDDWFTMLMMAKASLALSEGDAALAAERFGDVVRLTSEPLTLRNWLAGWAVDGARAAVASGDRPLAEHIVALAETIAERTPTAPTIVGVAIQTRALIDGDVAGLARGVEYLRNSPRPIVLAEALADHGRALVSAGGCDAGLDALTEAWTLFTTAGAHGAGAQIELFLRDAGLSHIRFQRRKRPEHGWAALTDAERRVAQLLAAGKTNGDAASELGLTRNTISSHARSIFSKLGVRSRFELGRYLSDRSS